MNSPILRTKIVYEPNGRYLHKRTYYLVKCPGCPESRWVQRWNYLRSPDALCFTCTIRRKSKRGNKRSAEIREEKIKQRLVCKHCGSKVFYECEDGWGCLYCGCIVYKDRVKLASLVKV